MAARLIPAIISALAVRRHLVLTTLLLGGLLNAARADAAETNVFSLPPEPVTITNISGKVYPNVWLDHATPDGVIYASQDKTSEGLIRYLDLTTNDLVRFKISPAVLDQAAARTTRRQRAEQAYHQAMLQALRRPPPAVDLAQTNNNTNTVQTATGNPIDTWENMKRAVGKPPKGKTVLLQ